MLIGGLQKFSLLDYPDHISAIIFVKGCNFHCHFCYNPMLVWPKLEAGKFKNNFAHINKSAPEKDHSLIKESDLFRFLKIRQGKLEAVVITGGEPTIYHDLPDFIKKIKKIGYLVKLDTNGTNPKMIKKLIGNNLVDYIAMDIKASKEKYMKITGVKVDFIKILKSVKMIIGSGIPYEFRTTIVPEYIAKEDIEKIGELINKADIWYLQKFKIGTELVDNKLKKIKQLTDKEMEEMRVVGKKYVKKCEVR